MREDVGLVGDPCDIVPHSALKRFATVIQADTLDPLPNWNLDRMYQAALEAVSMELAKPWGEVKPEDKPPVVPAVEEIRVLAWKLEKNVHDLAPTEQVLLWIRVTGSDPRWAIVNVYHHSDSYFSMCPDRWDWILGLEPPATFGIRLYRSPPGNADVRSFVAWLHYGELEKYYDDVVVRGNLRERSWRLAIGKSPNGALPHDW